MRRGGGAVSHADTAGGGTAPTRRQVSPRRPRLSPNVTSALAAALGALAIAGGYLGSTAENPLPPDAPRASTPVADSNAVVRGAYAPELGPFALPWIWLSDRGSFFVQNASDRTGYIGFLGASLRRPRTVRAGNSPSVRVDLLPRSYLIGPLRLTPGDVPIRVSPRAERASSADSRRVSVFLSSPVVSHEPFAAIPGKGFYPAEQASDGHFSWMTERGVLELVAPPALDGVAVIRVRMWSPTRRRVRLERVDVSSSKTVSLVARRVHSVVVGGIRMRSGRGRLTLTTVTAGPRGRDSRRLSLRLLDVTRLP